MSQKIVRLEVESFRGVRRLQVPIEGKNLIVVGENGAGKSSLIDAVEFCLTGGLESLSGRADVSESQGIPYLGGGQPRVKLSVGSTMAAHIERHFPSKKVKVPESLQHFTSLARRRRFVLRRAELLAFIMERPAGRYKEVSRLVGLAEIDKADNTWRGELQRLESEGRTLAAKRAGILKELSSALRTTVDGEDELVQQLNRLLNEHEIAPVETIAELGTRLQQISATDAAKARAESLTRLSLVQHNVREVQKSLGDVLQSEQVRQEALKAYQQQQRALENSEFEELLSLAHELLTPQPDLQQCPLCMQPIADAQTFLSNLKDRLTTVRSITRARTASDETRAQLVRDLHGLLQRTAQLKERLSEADLNRYQLPLRRMDETLQSWRRNLKQPNGSVFLAPDSSSWLPGLKKLEEELNRRLAAAGLSAREQSMLRLLDLLPRIDEHWTRLQAVEWELGRQERVVKQVRIAYEQLLEARRHGLEQLRTELEDDFKRLYQQLHPDEGYDSIQIPVHEDRRNSLDLEADFYGKDTAHPLNYFSEGHLDSLGLCIFLAFIKKFNADFKIIALDDVLATVDAGHRLRVARLLAREFADYQLIITTHDKLWAEHLRRTLPRAKLLQLRPWDLQGGTDYHEQLSDWNYYRQMAADGRAQDAIAGTGRNLEKFLGQMRVNLRLSVPARPDERYTIGDLHDPFFRWVRDHPVERRHVPDFGKQIERLYEELGPIWKLRNYAGAHFNEWAANVSRHEAAAFINSVELLVEAFRCPKCDTLVSYEQDPPVLYCRNCKPPLPRVVEWQYRSGWKKQATALLAYNSSKARENAVPMAQSRWEDFLYDARRRLPLANAGDGSLYEGFFDWLARHPRKRASSWAENVATLERRLNAYRDGKGWRKITPSEAEAFIAAVGDVTSLLECDECNGILDYDSDGERYFCQEFAATETDELPRPACWPIRR